jgi:hypothetical protein
MSTRADLFKSNRGHGRAHEKGGAPVGTPPAFQDLTMLNIDESPATGKVRPLISDVSPERKAALWLDAEAAKAKSGITTQVVELTPALARVLLERNEGNRNLIDSVTDAYIRDIESGSWSFNGQTIIVASDGMLNDGQHRCTAVVASNMSIRTVLVVGVPRATRMTLDQGRARRTGDYLSMDGYIHVNQLATAAGFTILYESRGTLLGGGGSKPTKTEIRSFIRAHPGITDSVDMVQIKGADAYGGRSMLAFCHWQIAKKAGVEDASKFIRSLIVGDGLLSRDPILYCRNRLVSERLRLRPNDRAELIFRAWNAHRTRRQPSTIPILGGPLPVLEG